MTVTAAPATIFDMADMSQGISRLQWRITNETFRNGQCFALRAGDELIALAGLYPLPDGGAEGWFRFRREQASKHIPGIIRCVRLTLAQSAYRAVVTVVATEAGARFARASGFVFAKDSPDGEVWAYGGLPGRRTLEEGDRGTAAA